MFVKSRFKFCEFGLKHLSPSHHKKSANHKFWDIHCTCRISNQFEITVTHLKSINPAEVLICAFFTVNLLYCDSWACQAKMYIRTYVESEMKDLTASAQSTQLPHYPLVKSIENCRLHLPIVKYPDETVRVRSCAFCIVRRHILD